MVYDAISSNINGVLPINPSANVLVFEDFNSHDKDWLTYSGGTDRPREVCYIFSISYDLIQMVSLLTQIPDFAGDNAGSEFGQHKVLTKFKIVLTA